MYRLFLQFNKPQFNKPIKLCKKILYFYENLKKNFVKTKLNTYNKSLDDPYFRGIVRYDKNKLYLYKSQQKNFKHSVIEVKLCILLIARPYWCIILLRLYKLISEKFNYTEKFSTFLKTH